MTTTDLTDIERVGDGKADSLQAAGFDSIGAVSEATIDELSEADGFGEGNAGDVIESATELLDTDGDAGTAEAQADDESLGDPAVHDTAEADAVWEKGSEDVPWSEEDLTELVGIDASVGDNTYAVELETDAQILTHVVHVVLEEATSQHQSSNFPLRDTTYGLGRKLMTALMQSGQLVDTQIVCTSEELSAFYRALTAGSSDYAGRSGIPEMWAEFETIRTHVNEKRKESMAD